MIDNLSILLSHVLIAISFYFLLSRDDLDHEDPPIPDKEPEGFSKRLSPSAKNRSSNMVENPGNVVKAIDKADLNKAGPNKAGLNKAGGKNPIKGNMRA